MDLPLRHHRQTLLPWIGPAGQQRLAQSRVLLIGCGALGCVVADQLVRAGVGTLRLADRDIVEPSNLQRQTLFDEADVAEEVPKAVAAARRLARIDSAVRIEPVVVDVHAGNIAGLAEFGGALADLIVDGSDNAPLRYLVNDLAVSRGIPWVYGAAVGTEGRAMAIRPGCTPPWPCLRCVFPSPPAAGSLPTCDTAGVLAATCGLVASWQAMLAIRLLLGQLDRPALLTANLWEQHVRVVDLREAARPECACCVPRKQEFLDARPAGDVSLCGRQAVQIRPDGPVDVSAIEARLGVAGQVRRRPWFVECALAEPAGVTLTLFPDGRVIVKGTADLARARSLVARYLGI
jgi:molybdopterin/thiamine biosynthesis adenylyltransferase